MIEYKVEYIFFCHCMLKVFLFIHLLNIKQVSSYPAKRRQTRKVDTTGSPKRIPTPVQVGSVTSSKQTPSIFLSVEVA